MLRNPLFAVLLVVGLVSGFVFLFQLDRLPIRLWDEARNAENAIEMFQNQHWVIRYYYGKPDFYELKPPLLIWAQVLSLNVFGINEWAIRLPSALAAIGTCLLLTYFIGRHFHPLAGLMAGLTLASTPAYYGEHMGRSGDHDALLVLFTTMAFFSVFMASEKNDYRWLVIACVFIFLGWATKSIAAFFITPALVLWLLISGNGKLIIRPRIILVVCLCLLLIASYYVFHEFATPDYLKEVIANEWWGRYLNRSYNSEYREESFWYYFKQWPQRQNMFWPLIFCCIPAWFITREKKTKDYTLYAFVTILLTLIILSAGTKNFWYDGIILPISASLTGISVWVVLEKLTSGLRGNLVFVLLTLACLMGVFNPVQLAIHRIKDQTEQAWDNEVYGIGYFLKNDENMQTIGKAKLFPVFNEINNHLHFYREKWNLSGQFVSIKSAIPKDIEIGDKIIVSQWSLIDSLKMDSTFKQVETGANYFLFEKYKR